MSKNKSNIQIVQNYLDGVRPFISVGYTGPKEKRKVGDRWEDSKGVTWEQRDGYVTRVNKQADAIRKATTQQCTCGQDIRYGDKLDRLFYQKTGKCFDCITTEETEYRALGVFPLYEKYKMISNYLGFLTDMKGKIQDSISYLATEGGDMSIVCNSEGFIEKFKGLNTTELLENAKKDLIEITKVIETVMKDKMEIKKVFETELEKARAPYLSKHA